MKNLFPLYRQGFIPGPLETEKAFLQRVEKSLHSRPQQVAAVSQNAARSSVFALYGIDPHWVSVNISAQGLHLWEAGCAWQDVEGLPQIQLHPRRRQSVHAEILAHEVVHAVRMPFCESRFEEILAFRTSSSRWRRFFGPLFQKTSETWWFFLAVLTDMTQILFQGTSFCATLLIFLILFFRLSWNQWRFFVCRKKMADPKLMIFLTDREIVAVAKGKQFAKLDDGSLRWKMLKNCLDRPFS